MKDMSKFLVALGFIVGMAFYAANEAKADVNTNVYGGSYVEQPNSYAQNQYYAALAARAQEESNFIHAQTQALYAAQREAATYRGPFINQGQPSFIPQAPVYQGGY